MSVNYNSYFEHVQNFGQYFSLSILGFSESVLLVAFGKHTL